MAKFYFDGHIRYRKSKDIMMIGVQKIVTGKHATYLEFPPRKLFLGGDELRSVIAALGR